MHEALALPELPRLHRSAGMQRLEPLVAAEKTVSAAAPQYA
jgi:hypothetical protein